MRGIPTNTIAVDFDGVIMRRDGTHRPIKGAREGLNKLKRKGYTVAIHSTRALSQKGEDFIRRWLESHHMPFDDVTSRKVHAKTYIDDKAEHFTSWADVRGHRGLSVWQAYEQAKAELEYSE